MKAVAASVWATLLATQALAAKMSFRNAAAPAGAPSAAPGASPSPGPAEPGLPVIDVDFEITNYNYYDLGKALDRNVAEPDLKWGSKDQQGKTPEQLNREIVDEASVADSADNSKASSSPLDWVMPPVKNGGLVQLGKALDEPMKNCRTSHKNPPSCVRDLLEDAVCNSVVNMVEEELAKPAAAPAPSPAGPAPAPVAAFVETNSGAPAPASGGAPGPAPAPSNVAAPAAAPEPILCHVTFQPGSSKNLALLDNGAAVKNNPEESVGRSIKAEVTITTHTGDDMDEEPQIMQMLDRTLKSGTLGEKISDALLEATGLMAVIDGIIVGTHQMQQWNIDTCEAHVKSVVHQFTKAYTRRMVPMAIYNECTNFMARVSFSNNAHITDVDTQRCQKATIKFEKGWDYAKKDFDYSAFCADVCEVKYGKEMPKCHVTSGKKILAGGP